jgi:hypothetical protein
MFWNFRNLVAYAGVLDSITSSAEDNSNALSTSNHFAGGEWMST